jgi:hypothetical protein
VEIPKAENTSAKFKINLKKLTETIFPSRTSYIKYNDLFIVINRITNTEKRFITQ